MALVMSMQRLSPGNYRTCLSECQYWKTVLQSNGILTGERAREEKKRARREGDLGMKRAGRNRAAKPRLSNAPCPCFSTLPRLDSAEERVTKFGHTRSRFVGQR
ncbi:Os01g0829300 [Oryza sativa Japonica Group]|uniref:Os01g0829300 protein n=1 Tax=Oryza sativa subsp. japonica TaxID=39947 RepID=C7IXY8_ORYSJ|nr:Os01g0829300 [Oryza sativa Japonica Group]|eukprot:NP_001172634.1 Os01g0829300 [Oryza sativa Japonica Group]